MGIGHHYFGIATFNLVSTIYVCQNLASNLLSNVLTHYPPSDFCKRIIVADPPLCNRPANPYYTHHCKKLLLQTTLLVTGWPIQIIQIIAKKLIRQTSKDKSLQKKWSQNTENPLCNRPAYPDNPDHLPKIIIIAIHPSIRVCAGSFQSLLLSELTAPQGITRDATNPPSL